MARLKRRVLSADSAPLELLNPDLSIWKSGKASAAWLDQMGLDVSGGHGRAVGTMSPLTRHAYAARVWALAAGLTETLANGKPWPDVTALRSAGVPSDPGRRIVEAVTHAGVIIEM